MKIGVDAFFLSMKNNTGMGNYVLDILVGISAHESDDEYILFTPSVYHNKITEEILKNKKFKIVLVKSIFSKRRLWLQSWSLRREIIKSGIDIFWGGREYIPVTLPERIITCASILDVVFKVLPETVAFKDKIFYYLLLPFSVRKTDFFITISEHSKSEIIQYFSINPERVFVINCGINLRKFVVGNYSLKENFILFVGTLQPRKNLISLIEAFELVADKIDQKLIIVGASGWKNNIISQKIHSLSVSIQDRIEFKGFVDSDVLIELYQKASLLVVPSLHEGFGLIYAEAIVCGTPVIATNRGAILELYEDKLIYVNPLCSVDISEKIYQILNDDERRKKMIADGFEFIKKYDLDKISAEFMMFFSNFNKMDS